MHPYSQSQETGAIRLHGPLSRAKEDGMRVAVLLLLSVILPPAVSAADLTIRILDPHSAAVAGAQVSLLAEHGQIPLRTATPSSQGEASIANLPRGNYRLRILAPGFAPQT